MSKLSEIEVFVEVLERGGFTAAADRLEISKAAVSKSVQQLENRLGARLLNRTTRRISLTEAGAALYEKVGNSIADIAAAEAEVMDLAGTPRGLLRISAPVYFAQLFLMPLIGRFIRENPNIEVEVDFDNRIVDLVKERFDVGIRITTLTNSSLVARRLAEVHLVTVASPAYLREAGKPVKPTDLLDHTGITYTLDRVPNEWHYMGDGKRLMTVQIRSKVRCNNDEALKQAALDGIGVARFPEIFVLKEIANGQLVRLLQDFDLPPSSLCAVFPTRTNLPLKVRVLVDFLVEQMQSELSQPSQLISDFVGDCQNFRS